MRQLIFRAWHRPSESMVQVNDLSISASVINQGSKYMPISETEVMQYIGINDKNGKKIYEGDILTGWRKGSNSDRGYTGVVRWHQPSASFYIAAGKYHMEIYSLAMSGNDEYVQLDSFAVIGNIYEHPHLLTTP